MNDRWTLRCVCVVTLVGVAMTTTRSPSAAVATLIRTRPRLDRDHPFNPENPSYASLVRANKEEGTCVISIMVDTAGWIRAVQLVVPSEHPHIDLACLMAGVGGRMLPATLDGEPIVGWATFPIQWHLNRSDPRFPTTPIPDSVPRIADDAELTVGPEYYPIDARKRRDEGDCAVSLSVSEAGAVDGSRVLRSSGSKELDRACIEAASHVSFLPAKAGGHAIRGETTLAVYWRLQ